MLNDIKVWIVSILIGAFIINIVDMILPPSKIKPYINLVVNFIFVFIVITPVISFFSKDMGLEDTILKYMGEYNKQYVDSNNNLAGQMGKDNLSKGYEDGLKDVLKLKLEEHGYELEDIEFDGSDINNIKIKEKNNSNNEDKKDIQSSKNEKSKQVFKDKESKTEETEHELDLSKEKLKDDLVKILDVSIETIEID